MGKASRVKGAAFERHIVNTLKPIFPDTKRNLAQTRDGGYDIAVGPYLIECKVGKQPNIRAAMEQCKRAVEQVDKPMYPVVVSKRDREDTLVTMQWQAFEQLLAAVYGYRDGWEELDKDD